MEVHLGAGRVFEVGNMSPDLKNEMFTLGPILILGPHFLSGLALWTDRVEGDLLEWHNKETLGIGFHSPGLAGDRCLCAVSSNHCLISRGTVFRLLIPQ